MPNYWYPLGIGGGGQYDFFDGSIDDLAIFTYAMSAANVSQLYAGYRVASWLAGTTTSAQISATVPSGATSLLAVAVPRHARSGSPI